jgi:hypothetical protein
LWILQTERFGRPEVYHQFELRAITRHSAREGADNCESLAETLVRNARRDVDATGSSHTDGRQRTAAARARQLHHERPAPHRR